MKLINKFLGLGLLILFASACAKDNYTEPNRQIKVKILSRTDKVPIPTENKRTNSMNFNVVQIDEKWTLSGTDNAYTNNDGEVNMKWYDGTYLFFAPNGRGPWKQKYSNGQDTIVMEINGNKTYEYEYLVDPYYLFENVKYTLNGNVLTVTGTIKEYNPVAIIGLQLVTRNSPLIGMQYKDQTEAFTLTTPTSVANNPSTFTITMNVNAANMEKASLYARVMMRFQGKTDNDWQMGPLQKMK